MEYMEKGQLEIGIFIDLAKAYDCLNTELIIIKLESYGVKANANKWIQSYLTGRKQTAGSNCNQSWSNF